MKKSNVRVEQYPQFQLSFVHECPFGGCRIESIIKLTEVVQDFLKSLDQRRPKALSVIGCSG